MTFPEQPEESDVILAVTDIAGFARAAKPKTSLQTFELLAECYDLVGTIIEAAGGRFIKFIGDASLIVSPAIFRSKRFPLCARSKREQAVC
ncbi:MAG: hypothetical protein H0U23_01990 [Blastocatellia bacterium]|nr:hypothetical protein [Blastocatellia bacterium]